MKKTMAVIGALMLGSAAAHADQIDWYNDEFGPLIYNQSGVLIPDASTYFLQIWEDVGHNGLGITSDDVYSGLTSTFMGGGQDGVFSTSVDPVGSTLAVGDAVYTRVYNPAGTWYVVPDDATATVTDSSGIGTPMVYDVGGSNPSGSDWVQVPEPTTLALLGIGLAGAAVRRSRKK